MIILIAGVWGGLIPFLGPTFHFTLGPDVAWHWTTSRLWLSVLPAIAAILGGLILMGRGPRLSGRFGALLALAGGVWFAVGPDVSMLWNHGVSAAGVPHGRHVVTRMLEFLTLHSGIGVLITALAAYSLPGVTYIGRRRGVEEDAAIAGTGAAVGAGAEARHRDRVAEREGEPVAAGGHRRVGRDAAVAGTGAAAGAAAEAHHRDRVEEREGAPAVTRRGADGGVDEPAGNGAGSEATAGNRAAEPTAGNGAAEPTAGNGAAEPETADAQSGTRRRGGLVGRFSRH